MYNVTVSTCSCVLLLRKELIKMFCETIVKILFVLFWENKYLHFRVVQTGINFQICFFGCISPPI